MKLRMLKRVSALMVAFGVVAGPAAAQDGAAARPFCADRPGLGTPACTLAPGDVMVEVAAIDWTRQTDPGLRSDALVAGDALVRVGVGPATEVQLGWAAFGRVRSLDRSTGARDTVSGTGDVALVVRHNLSSPDGSGFSAAVMPFATLPTGGRAIGAGDWGAGLIVPLGWGLSDALSLGLTPAVEAAVDGDGDGRHLAFGSVIGLGISLGETVSSAIEVQVTRDDDPAGASTAALAGLSFAWEAGEALQFDIGGVAGLDSGSPDVQLYIGVARRF